MKYATKTPSHKVLYSDYIQWIINIFLSVFVPLWQKTYFSESTQNLKMDNLVFVFQKMT